MMSDFVSNGRTIATMSPSDAALWKAFSREGDEEAFKELSRRYLGLIYHAALRRCASSQLSEEAAQNTLCLLARKMRRRRSQAPDHLAAWLHRAATYEAANLAKKEHRHQNRTRALMEDPSISTAPQDHAWDAALPHLDESLARLNEQDREVVILHYLERKTHREIAQSLGKSEAAVQKRCHRCLAKLARSLRKKLGNPSHLGGASLAALLTRESAKSAPAELLARSPSAALATTGAGSLTLIQQAALLMTTNQKIGLTTLAVTCLAAIPITIQHVQLRNLHQENLALQNALQNQNPSPSLLAKGSKTPTELRKATTADPGSLAWPTSPREAVQQALELFEGSALDERLMLGSLHYSKLGRHLLAEFCTASAEEAQEGVRRGSELLAALSRPASRSVAARSGSEADGAIQAFLRALAISDPITAKALAATMKAPHDDEAKATLVSGLSENNPREALAFLKALPPSELAKGMDDLTALERMAEYDPAAVAKLIDQLPMNNEASRKYHRLAATWVKMDPEKAYAWAAGLEFESVRSSTLQAVYRAWVTEDRDAAYAALSRLESSPFRRTVFSQMASEIFEQESIQAAEAWTKSLEGSDRTHALGILASHVGETDPARAVAFHREALEGARSDRTPLGDRSRSSSPT